MGRMMRVSGYILAICLILIACSPASPPVEDEELAAFVETFSECARVYRMYSHDEEMFPHELSLIEFPENWGEMVDSLTALHGGDLEFWTAAFTEISDRSRR